MGISLYFYGFLVKSSYLTVSSNSSCSVKAVDLRNKKKKEELRWRNGHILQSVKNHGTHAIHLNNIKDACFDFLVFKIMNIFRRTE